MATKPAPKRSVPHGWPADWPIPIVEERGEAAVFLRDEAARIIHTQKALIAGGYRDAPDEMQLRKAVSFHNMARFMELCAPFRQDVIALLKRLSEERSR